MNAPDDSTRLPPLRTPHTRPASAARRRRSPLWMVAREPLTNGLVAYLAEAREHIEARPDVEHTLRFSRAHLEQVREAFVRTIRLGESQLHHLCALLSGVLFDEDYDLQSVVIGALPATEHGHGRRFTLKQEVTHRTLHARTDLDLGSRMLEQVRYRIGDEWVQPSLVANFVEYRAHQPNPFSVHKIVSRIKAEEELWNKVCDEIFDLDRLVKRDKELRRLSRYVKDIFGIKIVLADAPAAHRLHEQLQVLQFAAPALTALGLPHTQRNDALRFIEVKNYLESGNPKHSGWRAIKTVALWSQGIFEIQLQPLSNYVLERERLTQESHESFKTRREQIRDQVAARLPLFGFFRELLRWLTYAPEGAPPSHPSVRIDLVP